MVKKDKFPKVVRDEVKTELIASTGHAMLENAKTPDKYPDVDTFVTLVDLTIDQQKLKRYKDGETEEQLWQTARLKGEYAKGTPEEIAISITFKCRKKVDLNNFLKGRKTTDDEYNVKMR